MNKSKSEISVRVTRKIIAQKRKCIFIHYNRKKLVKCGHDDKAHYAKGLCNNCYHKYGRTKKPWNCPHDKLYAGGMCQNCYINMYNKKKREENHPNDERIDSASQMKEALIIVVS